MEQLLSSVTQTLTAAFSMFWEVLWPLVLGFTLSAIVQAAVSHKTLAKTLGSTSAKSVTIASLFGIASSSCSYAAIALARSLFQKGASFANAMIFEIASTNLVIELGLILLFVLGWQFALAEWLGGIVMIILLALIFRVTLSKKIVQQAQQQAAKGLLGRMEGHAAMDMSIEGDQSFWNKLLSKKGLTVTSHFFVMDWVSIWLDLALGFLIAGALEVFVPETFWRTFFFANNHLVSFIVGPIIGPLVAIISFVCSVGNVPLAAVLWKGGISFGGVVSFIFADLLILPILDIYRKYYGGKVAAYIFVTFYVAIVLAGYITELLFAALHIIPTERDIVILESGISWNYTTFLNIGFLLVAVVLLVRFFRTNGIAMLRMMGISEKGMEHHH